MITEHDSPDRGGDRYRPIIEGGEVIEPLRDPIIGRASHSIKDLIDGSIIAKERGDRGGACECHPGRRHREGRIRARCSSCESVRGLRPAPRPRPLDGKPWRLASRSGVMAAQSIGEPAPSSLMRMFHIGGLDRERHQPADDAEAKTPALVKFDNVTTVATRRATWWSWNRWVR